MSTTNQLKILHILSQRPDSTGSGIYLQAMIRESKSFGYDNFLIAGVQSDDCSEVTCIEQDKHQLVTFYDAKVSFRIPGMSDVMPYPSSRFCDLSEDNLCEYEKAFSETIQNAVHQFKPDILHTHHLWIVSALTRRLFPDIPIVTSCHGSDLRQFQNCIHLRGRILDRIRQLNAILALSKSQKVDIERLYKIDSGKIVITGAGFNDKLFFLESKPAPDPVELVYVGKLSKAKGVPWLLRSLKGISYPRWRLHLIGSGSGKERDECLSLAAALEDSVLIHGALTQERLAEIVRKSHILILPSFYEGLPLVVLEGLASGCRIVATDLPGTMELIGTTNTDFISLVKTPRLRFLDQPYCEDEPSFEKHLAKAIQTQMLEACRQPAIHLKPIQHIIDSYTWKGVFRKVHDVYKLCLLDWKSAG